MLKKVSASALMMPMLKKVGASALVMLIMIAGMTNPALAQTCDTANVYSACSLATGIDFTELMKGIMIIATAVVGIGVLIFGAKLIINWARGRIS